MSIRRAFFAAKQWSVYRLDQFVGWTPLVQVPVLVLLTVVLILAWSLVLRLVAGPTRGALWWTLTRFMDGGTFALDSGRGVRLVAVGVTASGILLLSLLTATIASKLSERIQDLRLGKSPVVERDHILILGFDSKVPLISLELARSHQRLKLVTLAAEDKTRQEGLLRRVRQTVGARVKIICRTGDTRSELALHRVGVRNARSIVVLAPSGLGEEAALRFTLSTLLAVRSACGAGFRGRIIVEARRASHRPILELVGEAGPVGAPLIPMEVIAADDIVARVLAQSVRHGAVYFALREILSFRGSELYLEPMPRELVGQTLETAHARVSRGIVLGVMFPDGRYHLASVRGDQILAAGDRLIVLARERGAASVGEWLPLPPAVPTPRNDEPTLPRIVAVLGHNRTLSCLVTELDAIMPASTVMRLSVPEIHDPDEERDLAEAIQRCRHVTIERRLWPHGQVRRPPALLEEADGVVILGCEDAQDLDGDASALTLLLQLRHARRNQAPAIKRLVTEVRDPASAQQIAGTFDDFLVSTDVVAMMLTQAAVEPDLTAVYRELLDPVGAELCVRSRGYYLPPGPATFGTLMAAARTRGEIAIGFFDPAAPPRICPDQRDPNFDELVSPIQLNPSRHAQVPVDESICVLAIAQSLS